LIPVIFSANRCFVAKRRTAKWPEQLNRKCPPRNKAGDPTTFNSLYTDPERHSAQCYRHTDGQTDTNVMTTEVKKIK